MTTAPAAPAPPVWFAAPLNAPEPPPPGADPAAPFAETKLGNWLLPPPLGAPPPEPPNTACPTRTRPGPPSSPEIFRSPPEPVPPCPGFAPELPVVEVIEPPPVPPVADTVLHELVPPELPAAPETPVPPAPIVTVSVELRSLAWNNFLAYPPAPPPAPSPWPVPAPAPPPPAPPPPHTSTIAARRPDGFVHVPLELNTCMFGKPGARILSPAEKGIESPQSA